MKKLKEWLANNFISIISLFSSLLGTGLIAIWKAISQVITVLDWVLISILLAESVFFIIFAVWRKYSYKSYHYPSSKIKPTHIIENHEIFYKVTANNQLAYSVIQNIECSSNNLSNIPYKFIWTGKSQANLPKDQLDYHFVKSQHKGIWTYYDASLVDCLLKGQKKQIIREFDLIDDCTSSKPYVSVNTDMPTKRIKFSINLGNFVDGVIAKFQEYRSNEGDYPLSSKDIPIENGKIEFEVPHPQRFRYYKISWNWK